ncbi:hypothetical protein BGW42_001687 [Actinomortierella wolfii]|nr:hypothetical protein BGW42_001687 [Actinomortierella wolfii]
MESATSGHPHHNTVETHSTIESIREFDPADLHSVLVASSNTTESSMLSPHPGKTLYTHHGKRYLTKHPGDIEDDADIDVENMDEELGMVRPPKGSFRPASLRGRGNESDIRKAVAAYRSPTGVAAAVAAIHPLLLSGMDESRVAPSAGHPPDTELKSFSPSLLSLPARVTKESLSKRHKEEPILPTVGKSADHSSTASKAKAKGGNINHQKTDNEAPSIGRSGITHSGPHQQSAGSTKHALKEIRMDSYTVVVPVQRQRWYVLSVLAQWRMSRIIFVPRSKVLVIIDLETEKAESLILYSMECANPSLALQRQQLSPEHRDVQGEESKRTTGSHQSSAIISSSQGQGGQVQDKVQKDDRAEGGKVKGDEAKPPRRRCSVGNMSISKHLVDIPQGWNATIEARNTPSSELYDESDGNSLKNSNDASQSSAVSSSQVIGAAEAKHRSFPAEVTVPVEPESSSSAAAIRSSMSIVGAEVGKEGVPVIPSDPQDLSPSTATAVASSPFQHRGSTDSSARLDDLRRGLPSSIQIFATDGLENDEASSSSQDEFVIRVISIHNQCWLVQLPDKKTMDRWLEIGQMVRRDNWITSHEQQQEEERQRRQQSVLEQRRLQQQRQRQLEAQLEQQREQIQQQREQLQLQEKQIQQQRLHQSWLQKQKQLKRPVQHEHPPLDNQEGDAAMGRQRRASTLSHIWDRFSHRFEHQQAVAGRLSSITGPAPASPPHVPLTRNSDHGLDHALALGPIRNRHGLQSDTHSSAGSGKALSAIPKDWELQMRRGTEASGVTDTTVLSDEDQHKYLHFIYEQHDEKVASNSAEGNCSSAVEMMVSRKLTVLNDPSSTPLTEAANGSTSHTPI